MGSARRSDATPAPLDHPDDAPRTPQQLRGTRHEDGLYERERQGRARGEARPASPRAVRWATRTRGRPRHERAAGLQAERCSGRPSSSGARSRCRRPASGPSTSRVASRRDVPNAAELQTVLDAAAQAGRLIAPGNCPLEVADLMQSLAVEAVAYRDAEGTSVPPYCAQIASASCATPPTPVDSVEACRW